MNNLFTILLNLYLLISIPIYWTPYRWSVLQNSYFTFGVLALFIISEFCLTKLRAFKNIWAGLFILISLSSIFIHNYYISEFTKKFSSFSLMSEGFIYVLCGLLFLKVIYEYGSTRLRDYPVLGLVLLIWVIRAVAEKSFTPIVFIVLFTVLYLFKKKQWTIAYFTFLPILAGILKFWQELWLNIQPRIWTNVVLIKDIALNPLGKGFDNTLNGNVIECDMFEKWGDKWGAVSATDKGLFVFPHNDYLNIARDLGIPALVCVICGLILLFKGVKNEPLTYLCLAILFMSAFQTTFYFPNNAVKYIPLFSLLAIRKGNL